MKPVLISHTSYQDFFLQQLRIHYGLGILIVKKDWPLIMNFWKTDLSHITLLLRDLYSAQEPEPQDPASMLRSYLFFLMTNPEKGITEWINEMHRTPIYAFLSGFELQNIPGVGTFYDFFKRLWIVSDIHLKPKRQKKRKSKPKRERRELKSTYY